MRGALKALFYFSFSALLFWLWWSTVRGATSPRLPPPAKAVELSPAPPLSIPQAEVDLEEFRWLYEEGSFKWH